LKPTKCILVWDKNRTGNYADAELAWASFDDFVKIYKTKNITPAVTNASVGPLAVVAFPFGLAFSVLISRSLGGGIYF